MSPLSYPVPATERFISYLMLELVIQGFFVMITCHVSKNSNIPLFKLKKRVSPEMFLSLKCLSDRNWNEVFQ